MSIESTYSPDRSKKWGKIDLLEQALLVILFGGAYGVLEVGEVDQDVVQHLPSVHTVAPPFDVAAYQVHDVLDELIVLGVLALFGGQRTLRTGDAVARSEVLLL